VTASATSGEAIRGGGAGPGLSRNQHQSHDAPSIIQLAAACAVVVINKVAQPS
jgi:hypothetical protein